MHVLSRKVSEWINSVESTNQDAYSDRILEEILDISDDIREMYNNNFKYTNLYELYKSKDGYCSVCGCKLRDDTGFGLGSVFVLDKCGKFYCMDCDNMFSDGDERIFDCNSFEAYE